MVRQRGASPPAGYYAIFFLPENSEMKYGREGESLLLLHLDRIIIAAVAIIIVIIIIIIIWGFVFAPVFPSAAALRGPTPQSFGRRRSTPDRSPDCPAEPVSLGPALGAKPGKLEECLPGGSGL